MVGKRLSLLIGENMEDKYLFKDKCDGCHRRMSRFYLIQEIVEILMKSDTPVGVKTWTDK